MDHLISLEVLGVFLMAGIQRLIDDRDANALSGIPLPMQVADGQTGVFIIF
jgi:hypothetical protein